MSPQTTAARTAFGPMVIVAWEQLLPAAQRIVRDEEAFFLLPAAGRLTVRACRWRPLRNWMLDLAEKKAPGVYGGLVCRKRYFDERVTEAIEDGIEAMVVLGAGLDTRSYRLATARGVSAREVDLPANSEYKRARLLERFGRVPEHLTLIALDFEKGTLADALAAASFRMEQRTMFIWEGVTQYLTEDAVRRTMAFLAQAAAGSRFAFTYVCRDFIEGTNLYGAEAIHERFLGKEKLWHFGLAPEEVAGFLREYGWTERDQAGPAEMAARYVAPTGRQLPILAMERCVYAEKA
jgi:methyltransferase (TIGR00027 family)